MIKQRRKNKPANQREWWGLLLAAARHGRMKISKQQQRFMGEKWLVARAMEACLWDNL
jgi:hypothetical protein